MSYCTACGASLDIGRFCTNCGHPTSVEAATDPTPGPTPGPTIGPTADPVQPPPVHEQPTPARYPLFADDPASPSAPEDVDALVTGTATYAVVAAPTRRRRRPAMLAGVVVVACLVLVSALVILLRDGTDDPAPDRAGPSQPAASAPSDQPAPTEDRPGDLAALTRVEAPPEGPTSVDVETGATISYAATNMLDGDPVTCWRTPGAADDAELTFRFDRALTVTSVGLVNGYAKTSRADGREYDWYAGNRRILEVEWTFDDGTTVRQELDERRELQVLDVGAVETSSVRLRILTVTPPGTGPAGKDNTAISDVALTGYAG